MPSACRNCYWWTPQDPPVTDGVGTRLGRCHELLEEYIHRGAPETIESGCCPAWIAAPNPIVCRLKRAVEANR